MWSSGWIAAACAALLGPGCGAGFEDFEASRPAEQALPPIELGGVTFEGYRGEQRELSVTAERATIDLVTRVADLERVTFSFSEDSRGQIEVAAPNGELKLDADDFVLSGGVVGSAQRGERFSTESVQYIASSRELVSSTPVELRRADLLLLAGGMRLGLDARRLRLIGGVNARVAPR